MYTASEMAKALDMSLSGVRNYNQHFRAHLSESAQVARGRRYTEDDLATLQRARKLSQRGYKIKDINEMLYLEPAPEESPLPEEQTQEAHQEQDVNTALVLINQVMTQQQHQHEREITAKDDLITELRDDKRELQEDKRHLQDELKEYRKPWYKKLFGRE